MSQLTVTSSPHIRHPDSVPKIMWSVVLALAPALVASGSFFGWRAFSVTGLSVLTALLSEAAVQRLRKIPVTLNDGSAVVTGLLVAFCMPATVHWYVPVVGSAAAILIAKHCFGGLGNNIWNPALVGRAIVHWSYAADMNPSSYPMARLNNPGEGFSGQMLDFFRRMAVDVCAQGAGGTPGVDVVTGASPMAAMKEIATGQAGLNAVADNLPRAFQSSAGPIAGGTNLSNAFLGYIGGNIGEVSALLLLLGAAYLIVRGYVRWYVPTLYIGTVAALVAVLPISVATGGADGQTSLVWAAAWQNGALWQFVGYHVLCGGLMLGALYMATDMVTSPLTGRGHVIFAIGCGVLTVLIRLYGGYPEGVCYSILLMNTTVPLIDRWTRPRVFGARLKKKEKVA